MSVTTKLDGMGRLLADGAVAGLEKLRDVIAATDDAAEKAHLREQERIIESAARKEATLQDELDRLLGNEDAIEERRYDRESAELEALGTAGEKSLELAEQIHEVKMEAILKQEEADKIAQVAQARSEGEALAKKTQDVKDQQDAKEEGVLASLQNELDRALGNEDAIEERRYEAQQAELAKLGESSELALELAKQIHEAKMADITEQSDKRQGEEEDIATKAMKGIKKVADETEGSLDRVRLGLEDLTRVDLSPLSSEAERLRRGFEGAREAAAGIGTMI